MIYWDMGMAMRVGRVPYLHAEPFYFDMVRRGIELYEMAPSAIVVAAEHGEIDAGPVPLADCFRLEDRFQPVAGFCVASVKQAGSIFLFSTVPLVELDGANIGITDEASSAPRLLQILLRLKYGVQPKAFVPLDAAPDAIGGSTNAPIHLTAIARHVGIDVPLKEWETVGHRVPLLVNLQPAGEYLGEDYYRAGGVPAVVAQLMSAGLIREGALTVNGRTLADNCRTAAILDDRVIRPFDRPLVADAGFLVLSGNLFDAAIMKTSVIGEEFRSRYLSNPDDPEAFEGPIVVFDGPEDYHRRIDDPALGITPATLLFMRGTGPIGYPGAAEVVNMRPPPT